MPSDSLPAGLVQVIKPHEPAGPSSSTEEAMSAAVTSALLDPGESMRVTSTGAACFEGVAQAHHSPGDGGQFDHEFVEGGSGGGHDGEVVDAVFGAGVVGVVGFAVVGEALDDAGGAGDVVDGGFQAQDVGDGGAGDVGVAQPGAGVGLGVEIEDADT